MGATRERTAKQLGFISRILARAPMIFAEAAESTTMMCHASDCWVDVVVRAGETQATNVVVLEAVNDPGVRKRVEVGSGGHVRA